MNLQVTEVSLAEIVLPKQSLKQHPEKQIQQIADSIQAYGFNDPIAIDENGEIIEGLGRVLAAKRLGMDQVPSIRLSHLSAAQKRAYRIAHNKITLNTDFDLETLREEFSQLCQLDESLLAFTGFSQSELDDLLSLPAMPELAPELTESLNSGETVTCPHCGGIVHV